MQSTVTTENLKPPNWLDRPLLAVFNLDREKALYGLFIALAVLTRLWDLGTRVMSHDETVHIQWSWYLFKGQGYSHTPLSHGPFLFHATALSYYLFGDNDFSARLVVALLGVVLVALPYTLRRWLGRTGALATSLFFLVSPSLLYYSRYIRHDIPIIVWSLVAVGAIFRYLDSARQPQAPEHSDRGEAKSETRRDDSAPTPRNLLILAAALSLMFATKEVSFIYVAILGISLVLLFFARLGAPHWKTPTWEQASRVLLWIVAAGLVLTILCSALAIIIREPPAKKTDGALPSIDETLGLESPQEKNDAPTTVADLIRKALNRIGIDRDLLRQVAKWAIFGIGIALTGYVGLLALGSPSHQHLVLTVLSVVGVVAVACSLLFASLGLVDLFPFKYRDCDQPPAPGIDPDQLECTQANCKLIQGRCQQSVPVVTGNNVIELDQTGARIAYWLSNFEIVIGVVLITIVTILTGLSVYGVLNYLMPFRAGEYPTLDLILFIGTFTLPFSSAFAINGLSKIVMRALFDISASFNALDYSEAGLLRSAGFVFIFLAVSVAVGVWWNWRRWLYSAAVFTVIFVVLFTTVFTNGVGLASGMVGSLGYWLEQQDVQRGSQPVYYYGLLVPLYEYLPLIGFFAAVIYLLLRGRKVGPSLIFVLFLILWTVLTWVAYTIAGEKMPWLTTHFAVPMALATGWLVGRLIEGRNWSNLLRRGGWLVPLVAIIGFPALWRALSPWLGGPNVVKPFSGYNMSQLDGTLEFLAALLVLTAAGYGLYWAWGRLGTDAVLRTLAATALTVLIVLTIRTAWAFAYVNYDYATEYLVYAHAAPDVHDVMEQIEDISRRTAGDLSLDVGYTADGSYPFIWYLRNYPNAVQLPKPPSRPDLEKSVIVAGDAEWSGIEPYLGDNYICNEYNFLWWPMQDYYGLTWERVRYALTNPQMRAALWDIIFRRDYRKYEQAADKTVRPSEWPLRDGFRFCVRRDVLAKVWSQAAIPTSSVPLDLGPVAPELPDYSGLERAAAADLVVSTLGDRGDWNGPHDMAADAAGNLYVADSNNHRIVKLSSEGQLLDTWDSTWWHGLEGWQPGCVDAAGNSLSLGDGQFCEPWAVTVGADNRVYIADTWNHRIQVFTTDGEFLGKFGTFGQSGSSVSGMPGEFYGPRDVAVDQNGFIYVSDTGNKRIQVFAPNWQHLRSFGGPGIIEGRLDEPVGLAIGPDVNESNKELLYVADTWNLRVQAFTLDGDYVREWSVPGWASQSTANKPYIAFDSAGRVYATDPEGQRVLVFDVQGNPLAVLGGPSSALFQLPTGILLDSRDNFWVSDAGTQRLLRFPPLTFDD